jgi:general secretion pathway protein G
VEVRCQRGLTLREILVLLLVLSAIAAGLSPIIHGRLGDYRLASTHAQLNEIAAALERYKLDNHFYPATAQGLEALIVLPATEPVPRNWNKGGYLDSDVISLDPWGNPYVYRDQDGGRYFELLSLGSDGELGGDDMASDIRSPAGG